MLSPDTTLEQRLLDGELDAAFLVRRPASLSVAGSGIKTLFADPTAAEQEWYARSRIFPIMHVVGIRKTLLQQDPSLARRVYDAFEAAKQIAVGELEVTQAPKVTLPWPHAAVADTRRLMGHDYWPYGIRANRQVLERQLEWSRLDALQARPVTIDELFAPETLNT